MYSNSWSSPWSDSPPTGPPITSTSHKTKHNHVKSQCRSAQIGIPTYSGRTLAGLSASFWRFLSFFPCGTPGDAQLNGGSVAEHGQTPAEATQRGFRRMGRASSMTGLEPPWNAPRQNGWDSGPCRGSREVGRRYVSRHPCHGNGAGYANHNPRVTNHNPRGTVTANRPPLSRRFQFLINFQRQWSHNQS